MVDNGIQPRDIVCNADNKRVTHGMLIVVFLPDPFTLVYKLSALGVILVRVFGPDMRQSCMLDLHYG